MHPKAMPVILTTPEEYEVWLSAPAEEALKLQQPLPDDMLEIVAEGSRLFRHTSVCHCETLILRTARRCSNLVLHVGRCH